MKEQLREFWAPILKDRPIEIPPEYDQVDCSKVYCFSKEEMDLHEKKKKIFLEERRKKFEKEL